MSLEEFFMLDDRRRVDFYLRSTKCDEPMEKTKSSRRQRKLPPIPQTRRNPPEFWPSYRGAISWLQAHQETVDRAFNLLELYPNLIQHRSCDKLWEFISKVAFMDNFEDHQKNRENTNAFNDPMSARTRKEKGSPLSLDNITRALDEIMNQSSPQKHKGQHPRKVCVCGNVDDEKWRHLVIDLCKRYHVRCHCARDDGANGETEPFVFDNDAILFLMDSKSMSNESYLQTLRTAYTWDIDTVYIRQKDFLLPDTLSICLKDRAGVTVPFEGTHPKPPQPKISHVNIQVPDIRITEVVTEATVRSCTPMYLNDQFLQGCPQTPTQGQRSVSAEGFLDVDRYVESPFHLHKPERFLRTPVSRPDSGLSSCSSISNSSHGYFSSSPKPYRSPSPYSYSSDQIRVEDGFRSYKSRNSKKDKPTNFYSNSSFSSAVGLEAKPSTPKIKSPESMVNIIKKGYRDALQYSLEHHTSALVTIVETLEKRTDYESDMEISEWVSSLRLNERKGVNEIQRKAEHDNSNTKDDCPIDDRLMQSGRNSVENAPSMSSSIVSNSGVDDTVFAVYSRDTSQPDLVRWPLAGLQKPLVANTLSVDSFGFQDIDLTRDLNTFDWDSDSFDES